MDKGKESIEIYGNSYGPYGLSPSTQRKRKVVTCRVTCTINNTKVVRTWSPSSPRSSKASNSSGKRVNLVKTAGSIGYKNAKRGSLYAAQELRARISKEYFEKEGSPGKQGNTGIHLRLRGIGRGRGVVINELIKAGFVRLTVSDATKDPHNGCRRKKQRRI